MPEFISPDEDSKLDVWHIIAAADGPVPDGTKPSAAAVMWCFVYN